MKLESILVDTIYKMKTLLLVVQLLLSITVRGQVITTIAGNGTFGFSGEGGPATNAEFDFLAGITTDKSGNVYLADRYNNIIQKLTFMEP